MWKLITEAWRYRYVTQNFVVTSLGNKYKRSVLGYLWSVLFPLLRYLVMGLMFAFVLQNKDTDFFPRFFLGMTVFTWISTVIGSSTRVYINNMAIMHKMYVPKLTFVLNNVLMELANYFLVLAALLILGTATGFLSPGLGILYSLPGLLVTFLFLVGFSLLLAVATVWFNDIQYLVDLLLQTLLFITPVMFPQSLLPEALYLFNPFYYFVEIVRYPLLTGNLPDGFSLGVGTMVAVVTLFLGLAVLRKNENGIVYRR